MTQSKKPTPVTPNPIRDALSHMVSFGPDKDEAPPQQTVSNEDANARLKSLLRQLEDLNKRVDKLNRYY